MIADFKKIKKTLMANNQICLRKSIFEKCNTK